KGVLITFLLALVALLGSVISVAAQSSEPPVRAVGETWTLSDGRMLSVTKVEEGWTSVTGGIRDCPTCILRIDRELNFDGVVQDASGKPIDLMQTPLRGVFVGPEWKFYQWPLEVGKHWRFTAKGFFNKQYVRYDVTTA